MTHDLRKTLIVGRRLQRMVTQLQHVPQTAIDATYQQIIANPLLNFHALLSQIETAQRVDSRDHGAPLIPTSRQTTLTEALLRRRALERNQFEPPEPDPFDAGQSDVQAEYGQYSAANIPQPAMPTLPEAYLAQRRSSTTPDARNRNDVPYTTSTQAVGSLPESGDHNDTRSQRLDQTPAGLQRETTTINGVEDAPASVTRGQSIPKADRWSRQQSNDVSTSDSSLMTRLAHSMGSMAHRMRHTLPNIPPMSQTSDETAHMPSTATELPQLQDERSASAFPPPDGMQVRAQDVPPFEGFRLSWDADQLVGIPRDNDIQSVQVDTEHAEQTVPSATYFETRQPESAANVDFSKLPPEVVDAILDRLIEQLELDMLRTYGTSGVS